HAVLDRIHDRFTGILRTSGTAAHDQVFEFDRLSGIVEYVRLADSSEAENKMIRVGPIKVPQRDRKEISQRDEVAAVDRSIDARKRLLRHRSGICLLRPSHQILARRLASTCRAVAPISQDIPHAYA